MAFHVIKIFIYNVNLVLTFSGNNQFMFINNKTALTLIEVITKC